jgi:hypothetical protein
MHFLQYDRTIPVDEQMKKEGLTTGINTSIYGVGAGWKRKVEGRIDVGGENALDLM